MKSEFVQTEYIKLILNSRKFIISGCVNIFIQPMNDFIITSYLSISTRE